MTAGEYLSPQQFRQHAVPTQYLPPAVQIAEDNAARWDQVEPPHAERVEHYRAKIRAGEDIQPVLLTRRGHVYDGHHRSVAHLAENAPVPVSRRA